MRNTSVFHKPILLGFHAVGRNRMAAHPPKERGEWTSKRRYYMRKWKRPDLDEGPHKQLNDALHDLREQAGGLSAEEISSQISNLPPGPGGKPVSISNSTVHNALTKPRLPAKGTVRAIVRVLVPHAHPTCDETKVEEVTNRYVRRFDSLHTAAAGSTAPGEPVSGPPSPDAALERLQAAIDQQQQMVLNRWSALEEIWMHTHMSRDRIQHDLLAESLKVDIEMCDRRRRALIEARDRAQQMRREFKREVEEEAERIRRLREQEQHLHDVIQGLRRYEHDQDALIRRSHQEALAELEALQDRPAIGPAVTDGHAPWGAILKQAGTPRGWLAVEDPEPGALPRDPAHGPEVPDASPLPPL